MGYASFGDLFSFISPLTPVMAPASGSSGGGFKCDLAQVIGFDYTRHPFVQYLAVAHPLLIQNWNQFNVQGLQNALIEFGYPGQPAPVVDQAALAACSQVAENNITAQGPLTDDLSCQMVTDADNCHQAMHAAIMAVAAMPKPTKPIQLKFPPGFMACVQAKGKWNPKTNTCTMQGAPRAGTPVPKPGTPVVPKSVTSPWLYSAGAAVVAGTVVYLIKRK